MAGEVDPVRALAATLAVDLARSNEPIEFGAGAEVAETVLVVAEVFEGYLRGGP